MAPLSFPAPSNFHPRRILVRGVNWLGDAVMTTPALQRLREAQPNARITLLTHQKLAGLWVDHPAVDEVLSFSEDDSVLNVARRLRVGKFDSALILPNSPRSALEAFLAAIPRRIGYAGAWRNIFLTHRVASSPDAVRMRKRSVREIKRLIASPPLQRHVIPPAAHHLHHYLRLAAALGANSAPLAPHIAVAADEIAAIRSRFGVPARTRLLGLNAGAEYGPAKRWPRERFIQTAVELRRKTNCHWWIFGGAGDVRLAKEIADAITQQASSALPPITNLAGQTSLREFCAALKSCEVLLTNDTGPMHLAAAVGTPVVVPFGSTSPELTGPGLPGDARHLLLQSGAPCAPCFRRECPIDFRCMTGIEVATVVKALLESGNGARASDQ